jgi:hypothetical protein
MTLPQICNPNDEITLVIGAFRYYLGRQSYGVSDFCDWLCLTWQVLELRTQYLIQTELEKTFQNDDEARAEGRRYLPLGMDMDRQEWERIRKLYRSPALYSRSPDYPPHWNDRVPARIKMLKNVASGMPGVRAIAVGGMEYSTWVNSHGAISAVLEDGKKLGVKPDEFEITEWI